MIPAFLVLLFGGPVLSRYVPVSYGGPAVPIPLSGMPVAPVHHTMPIIPVHAVGGMHMGTQGGMQEVSNSYGDGRGFNGAYRGVDAREAVREAGAAGSQGLQGYGGSYAAADGREGSEGIRRGVFGDQFQGGAGGFAASHNFHDAAGSANLGAAANSGHKKGHKTTGFHKTYHNVESGQDTEFVDEDHDNSERNSGISFGDKFFDGARRGYQGADQKGAYGEKLDAGWATGGAANSHSGVQSTWGGHDRNGHHADRDVLLQDYRTVANNNDNYGQSSYGRQGANGHHYQHHTPYVY